jgi:hypothetical protein
MIYRPGGVAGLVGGLEDWLLRRRRQDPLETPNPA